MPKKTYNKNAKKIAADKAAKANANKLISTVKGTSAINTKSKPESKAKSNFNYNTELAKKQKPDLIRTERITADKKAADKKAAAKVASGKKVKAVVE